MPAVVVVDHIADPGKMIAPSPADRLRLALLEARAEIDALGKHLTPTGQPPPAWVWVVQSMIGLTASIIPIAVDLTRE